MTQEKSGSVNLLDDYRLHQLSSSLVRITHSNAFIIHKHIQNYIKLAPNHLLEIEPNLAKINTPDSASSYSDACTLFMLVLSVVCEGI